MRPENLDARRKKAIEKIGKHRLRQNCLNIINAIEATSEWRFFDAGNYNLVFYQTYQPRETEKLRVLKCPFHPPNNPNYDDPIRNVRVSNEISKAVYPSREPAVVTIVADHQCAVFEYIPSETLREEEKDRLSAVEAISVYLHTGRVIADMSVFENSSYTRTGQHHRAEVIDVGGAIKRSQSPYSRLWWNGCRPNETFPTGIEAMSKNYIRGKNPNNPGFLTDCEQRFSARLTAPVIKTLLYLDDQLCQKKLDEQAVKTQVKTLLTNDVNHPINLPLAQAFAALYDMKKPFDFRMLSIPHDPALIEKLVAHYHSDNPTGYLDLFPQASNDGEKTLRDTVFGQKKKPQSTTNPAEFRASLFETKLEKDAPPPYELHKNHRARFINQNAFTASNNNPPPYEFQSQTVRP